MLHMLIQILTILGYRIDPHHAIARSRTPYAQIPIQNLLTILLRCTSAYSKAAIAINITPPPIISRLAPPVLCCTKALPVALELVLELLPVVLVALTAAAFVVVEYKLATIELQLDSALSTEEQPLHTDATAA